MTAAPRPAPNDDPTLPGERALLRAPSGPVVPGDGTPTAMPAPDALERGEAGGPSGLALFDALAPLVTDVLAAGRDGLKEAPAPARRAAGDDDRRRGLLLAIAELAETHAVAADLASEHATIDLPLDLPDAAGAPPPAGDPVRTLIVPDMIRAVRDRVANQASPGDRIKIDIVATIFDQLLADDRVPTAVRNALARMQLPVLRLALADDSFFASRTHPTRRLLDRLGVCASQWDYGTEAGRACRDELEGVVHALVHAAAEDASEHARLLQSFENRIAAIATGTRPLPSPAVTDPEDRDVLVIKATIQISQLLAGVDVDRTIRFFLLDVWSRVLVEIACAAATPSRDATLARAKRLCTDLAWSTMPKTTSGERARLAGVMPTMIAALRDGMALIAYSKVDEERFFAQWTRVLWQATRRSHLARDPRVPDDPVPSDDGDVDLFVRTLRERTFGVEPVRAHATPANAPIDEGLRPLGDDPPSLMRTDMSGERRGRGPRDPGVDTRPVIEQMTKGAWFELREPPRAFARVRLSWISPLRTFYLFVGADSAITRSFDPETLRDLVARGDLRLIAGPLIEGASRLRRA